MKSILGRVLGFVASLGLVIALSAPAWADREDHEHGPKPTHSAPQIDPAGLAAIGSLLVGGTLLLKSRRGARPKN